MSRYPFPGDEHFSSPEGDAFIALAEANGAVFRYEAIVTGRRDAGWTTGDGYYYANKANCAWVYIMEHGWSG